MKVDSEQRTQLKHLLEENAEMTVAYTAECLDMKDFEGLLAIFDVKPMLVKKALESHKDAQLFNDYMKKKGNLLLGIPTKMSRVHNSVAQNFKQSILDQFAHYRESLSESIVQMNPKSFWMFYDGLNAPEKASLLALVPSQDLATFLTAQPAKLEDIKKQRLPVQLSETSLKALSVKLNTKSAPKVETNKLVELSRYLPYDQEKMLRDEVAPNSVTVLEKYSQSYFEDIVRWVNSLELQEASQLLATFDPQMTQQIFAKMPDIKARRLKAQGCKLGAQSPVLKAQLIEHLEELEMIPEIPLEKPKQKPAKAA